MNADFAERAVVHAASLEWSPSPTVGVDRRMLDRVGGEVARATSIVRYAPRSRFPAHTHSGGEEFLVLEGVFSDEHGDYPTGSYLRNPPTSHHSPGSHPGCVIFVKLWQFDPVDRTDVRVAVEAIPAMAVTNRPGIEVQTLFEDREEHVRIETWASNTHVEIDAIDGLELLVLEGTLHEAGERFTYLSWLRLPVGSTLMADSGDEGCRIWIKTGHLRHTFAPPTTI